MRLKERRFASLPRSRHGCCVLSGCVCWRLSESRGRLCSAMCPGGARQPPRGEALKPTRASGMRSTRTPANFYSPCEDLEQRCTRQSGAMVSSEVSAGARAEATANFARRAKTIRRSRHTAQGRLEQTPWQRANHPPRRARRARFRRPVRRLRRGGPASSVNLSRTQTRRTP